MKKRFSRQIEHFGENSVFYALLTGNKCDIVYNGEIHNIENGLIELKMEDFNKYEIDIKLDYPKCILPNIKLINGLIV